MKTLPPVYCILMMFAFFSATFSTFAQNKSDIYCTAGSGCGFWITDVNIGTINNGPTACSSGGQGNYATMSTNAGIGQTLILTVTAAGTNSNTVCSAWVDWNINTLLTDAGEAITMGNSPGLGPYTATITVPSTANTGSTRLRIRIGTGTLAPCGSISQGETEDYTLIIHPGLILNTLGVTQFCTGQHFDFNFTSTLQYNAGNHFEAQLSDEFGGFSTYTVLGTLQGTSAGTIHGYFPQSISTGGSYRIRVASTSPQYFSQNNGSNLLILTGPDLQITNPAPVCQGIPVNITNSWNDLNGTGGNVSYWLDSTAATSLSLPQSVLNAGTYYVKMLTSDNCTDIKPVIVANYPQPVANAGPDNIVYTGIPYTMQASVASGTPPDTYIWSPAGGLSDPSVLNPVASPAVTTTYTLSVTDSHSCHSTDQVALTVMAPLLGNISGNITYDNTAHTIMNNVTVFLKDTVGNLITQTTTDGAGHYAFSNVNPGKYKLSASCSKQWGGVNAVDGLLIMKHFVGLNILTGIRLKAADVNASNNVNAVDALTANRRFVGLDNTFLAGDWAFESPVVILNPGANLQTDIKGICYGDVNGTFTPSAN